MPSIIEYRIPFPTTVLEYRVGMMWMILRASRSDLSRTRGRHGVEFLHHRQFSAAENEHAFGPGIYTEKVFHIARFLPRFLAPFIPDDNARLVERSWAAYPHRCITLYSSPALGPRPFLTIESRYLSDAGDTANALHLSDADLAARSVVTLNIADAPHLRAPVSSAPSPSPSDGAVAVRSDKQNMCVYKVCRMDIAAAPVETWAGRFLQSSFLRYHRQMFVLMDEWIGLGLADIPGALPEARKERVGVLFATELAADVTVMGLGGPELFDCADTSNPFA